MDPQRDGIPLGEWTAESEAPCALHPKGFPIFLPADRVDDCNEYAEEDPYNVETNIDGPFHQLRVDCTLELVASARIDLDGPARILDLGCGEGHITRDIHLAHDDAVIAGLDYSVSAISRAVDIVDAAEFAVGDAYLCPYPDSYFDLVVCNNLWEHVPDPLQLLKSMTRVLKPDGYVIISTPSRYSLWNLLKVIRGREVVRTTSRPTKISDLKSRIANVALERLISALGSHHRLEQAVFYLARRVSP